MGYRPRRPASPPEALPARYFEGRAVEGGAGSGVIAGEVQGRTPMKRLRFRGRWVWLGLLLAPAFSWAVVLALVPTEWARARMVNRLALATGRSVRIGAL